jgi:Rrf2 family protein
VEISARAEYAIRALAELTSAGGGPSTVADLAAAQDIPPRFLQNILLQLRQRGLVQSQRGAEGGYRLARPATTISLADIMRAVDGPLAAVRGERPESVHYEGPAEPLADVWLALRVSMRHVLERVSLEDLVNGPLPPDVTELIDNPDAWVSG